MKAAVIRVCRLEERLVLSASTYTDYAVLLIGTDGVTSQSYVTTFDWDVTDAGYQTALDNFSGVNDAAAAYSQYASAGATSSALADTISGAVVDAVGAAADYLYDSARDVTTIVAGLAKGLTPSYTDPTAGVTIDPSVTNAATAVTRAKLILNQQAIAGSRLHTITADINGTPGVLDKTAKILGYSDEIQAIAQNAKAAKAELNLMRDKYPAAFGP